LPALVDMIKTFSWNYIKLGFNLMQPKTTYSHQNGWITQCML